MKSILCEEKKKHDYAKVFQMRDEIELQKQKTKVITWALPLPIGYCLPLLLYPSIAMLGIIFKIESE